MDENQYFTKTLILIVSLSSLLLHTTTAIPLPRFVESRVTKICNGVTDPTLCLKTILPHLNGRFNPYKALEAEILATKTEAQKTSAAVDALLANPTTASNGRLKATLVICKDQYSNVLEAIENAYKQATLRNVVEARFKFSGAISFYESCNDAFKEDGNTAPFAKKGDALWNLEGNVLDIMKEIEDRESNRKWGKDGIPTGGSPPNPCQNVIGSCNLV